MASVLCALLAVGAGGGCELVVGDTVPAFECDPTAGACPGGQICSPATHQCVESCQAAGCLNGAKCDEDSGLCEAMEAAPPDVFVVDVRPGPDVMEAAPPEAEASAPEAGGMDAGPCAVASGKPIGCPCSGPGDCASAVCGDEQTLTSDIYKAAGNVSVCTQPCCTSGDCTTGSVCFGTGAGGNYCVLPSWLGRSLTPGTGLGGSSCSTGTGCLSGLCTSSGTCGDTCCSTGMASKECAGGEACSFGAFPGGNTFDTHDVPSCSTTSGTGANGDDCEQNSDCESNLCLPADFGNCVNACRNGTDCGSGNRCTYLEPNNGTSEIAAGCVQATGTIASGATCDPTDDKCATGFCAAPSGTMGTCVDVCFTNADCGDNQCLPTTIQFFVSGSAAGMFTVLACNGS